MAPEVSFGRFTFRLDQRRLWHDGVPVPLRPKEAELLAILGERRPDVAPRDEIIEALWSGNASDAALAQTLYRLRRTLARYESSELIETVPQRGFRLIGESPLSVQKMQPDSLRTTFALFQRATLLLQARTEAAVLSTIELLERVREREPDYGPAQEALAAAYCIAGIRQVYSPTEAYWRARHLIEYIISERSNSAQAFATLSTLLLFFNANREEAREAVERSMYLAPNSLFSHAAAVWERVSRRDFVGAVTHADLAVSADPASSYATALVGTALYMSRRYPEAHRAFEAACAIEPSQPTALFYDACSYAMEGDYSRAEQTLSFLHGNDMSTRVVAVRGYIAAKTGDAAGAARAIKSLRSGDAHISLSAVESALGEHARAAATLESAIRTREPGLFLAVVDPMFEQLQRRNPALMASIERGRPDACDRCGVRLTMKPPREIHQCDLCWDCRRAARTSCASS